MRWWTGTVHVDHPRCTVCARQDRAEIDAALSAGKEGINALARRLEIAKPTLMRHRAHSVAQVPIEEKNGAPSAVEAAPEKGVEPCRTTAPLPAPILEAPDDDLVSFGQGLSSAPVDPVTPSRVGRGRVCACCSSPLRAEVERRLCAGESAAAIEAALAPRGPSRQSIAHHARVCVPHLLGARAAELREEILTTVRGRVQALLERAERLVGDAEGDGAICRVCQEATGSASPRDRAATINACNAVLVTFARILGDLGAEVEIKQVLESPRWQAEREAVAEALLPFPEAAAAVVNRLRALPAGGGR